MFLYLGENRRIAALKDKISQKDAESLEQKGIGKYYTGKFSFFMGEDKPGFEKVFYLNEDGTIRIEYEEIPPEALKPTQLDRFEQAVNQSNAAFSKTYSEIENRVIDKYTISLVENNII